MLISDNAWHIWGLSDYLLPKISEVPLHKYGADQCWTPKYECCVGWFCYQPQVPPELQSPMGLRVCLGPLGNSSFHQTLREVCWVSLGCHLRCNCEFETALLSWRFQSPAGGEHWVSLPAVNTPFVPRDDVLIHSWTMQSFAFSSTVHFLQMPAPGPHPLPGGLALGALPQHWPWESFCMTQPWLPKYTLEIHRSPWQGKQRHMRCWEVLSPVTSLHCLPTLRTGCLRKWLFYPSVPVESGLYISGLQMPISMLYC